MYDPNTWYGRQSSFRPGIVPPGVEPGEQPLVAVYIASAWLPLLIGCVMQLAQPAIWLSTSATLIAQANQQAGDLAYLLGNAALSTQRAIMPINNGAGDSCWLTNGAPGLFVLND